ncbi:MAG: GTPase HflX [Anaerolineae bacterium]
MTAIERDLISTDHKIERGFLVGVELKRRPGLWRVEDSLAELAQLARTAGIKVVGQTVQRLERPHPATYIGKGKVEELALWKGELNYDVVVFDDELSPRQERNLEEALEVKILDRTALILDIFAQHARTKEGQLQVELAQYEYRLPRLTRMWTHLARQVGGAAGRGGIGGVGLRGPGETQLETDRREIRQRIARLRRELEQVRTHRRLYRQQRKRAAIPVVSIVGYTNAGKSTLLNALSGADVLVEDKLFATLDPTTRRVTLPEGKEVLFTDTVGFIQKLPTQLVAAFRATLEEIEEADVLLHIIDITHPNAREQCQAVEDTLAELGVAGKPRVTALNKIDLLLGERAYGLRVNPGELEASEAMRGVTNLYPDAVPISAEWGIGLERLLERVEEVLNAALISIRVCIPYQAGELLALLHRQGFVETEEHTAEGTLVEGRIPARFLAALRPYVA